MNRNKIETTWSLMHPTPLDPAYMKHVIAEADRSEWPVDSFEICALCHSVTGGLDGLAEYGKYALAGRDTAAVRENIRVLREIVQLAHASGRPVYYWHREVTVPAGLTDRIPELLDEKHEFNLLGPAFEKLICEKISQAFEAVPELDGIVLTLTEADFSAIHNSTPDRYPPAEVVRKVVSVFHRELTKRGKRFILRSFGSIAKDYEDILAGAALASDEGMRFEVETKITPYDFDPFLPSNPFLRHVGGLTLGAECDCLGEFLGAGNLPAENVVNIVRWVRAAQKAGVDRYAIRLDRIGNNVFEKYPVNIYAYMRAINDPEADEETICRDYLSRYLPPEAAAQRMELGRLGLEAVLKTNYVRGNVIFHAFPPNASFKYLKAGGFFANFSEHVPLKHLSGIWSVLSGNVTGTRAEVLAEKQEAVRLARKGIELLSSLKKYLPSAEAETLERLWNNLLCAASSLEAFCRCVAAYFDDMEHGDAARSRLAEAVRAAHEVFARWNPEKMERAGFVNGMEQSSAFKKELDISTIYPGPLAALSEMLTEEYDAEFAARHDPAFSGARDLLIPGSATDEWRCERFMHACHAILENGRPCRIVGNQVFPNGTLGFELKGARRSELLLDGTGPFSMTVNGGEAVRFELNGKKRFALPEAETYHLVFAKAGGTDYPKLRAAALFDL